MSDNIRTIVEMKGIGKSYPGVTALQDVSLRLQEGEVRALVGENGAGKSTLVKILTGAESQFEGDIIINGERVEQMTPPLSEDLGISCVYQSMMIANHLTVAENIWLGNMPNSFGIISQKKIKSLTEDLLKELGYNEIISADDKAGDLSISQRGLIAIARAISRKAKVVVFDEPTAVLAGHETDKLFEVIRALKKRGISVIYISHRIDEIFKICDTITVLRDGKVAAELEVNSTDTNELIAKMVGRRVSGDHYVKREIGSELFVAENLSNEKLHNCSLTLREREIVGIYGLVGAGRTELLRAIFGADRIHSGRLSIRGHRADHNSPEQSIREGLSFIPEDRRGQGLTLQQSVRDNINLAVYDINSTGGLINRRAESKVAKEFIDTLHIRTPDMHQKVKNLSGGNQQKCVIGKWLARGAEIFLMDEPTNGVDVGAKEEIYTLINDLASDGGAVLCVSSYVPELISICDRVLIMSSGRIIAEVRRGDQDFNEEALLASALKQA